VLLIIIVGFLGVFLSAVLPAHAAKIYFGTQDYLRPIQDVAIKGPNGEDLYLGNKYSFHSFVMPYSLSDDGYILGVKGRNAFFLLDKAKIERFQASGLLPTPLPAYELSALDYAMGHLLWGVLVFMVAFVGIGLLRRRRRQRALPYFSSALAHGESGNIDGAIADYTRAIEIDPKFNSALINRAGMYQRRGDYEPAIADFTKAIKIGPKELTVLAYVNRGITHQKMGDFDRAIADHTRAIELIKAPSAYYNRGNAFLGKGDHALAIANYTKAIELVPAWAAAYQARGGAYEAQGDAVLAQTDYKAAREIADRQRSATH
jgi:tetratricopeptide (TPR) repeat protein